jgi:hypothetical protein
MKHLSRFKTFLSYYKVFSVLVKKYDLNSQEMSQVYFHSYRPTTD